MNLTYERDRATGTYRASTNGHTYTVDHLDGRWSLIVRTRPAVSPTQSWHATSRDAMLAGNLHAFWNRPI